MPKSGHVRCLCWALEIPSPGLCSAPVTTEWWPTCPRYAKLYQEGRETLAQRDREAPCCCPDPSDLVWPILAVPDGGKCVTLSGSVTHSPNLTPLCTPPRPDMKQDYGGEKAPEAPLAQTNCSRESPSRPACLFYKLSPTDASRGRLHFLFFLNTHFF